MKCLLIRYRRSYQGDRILRTQTEVDLATLDDLLALYRTKDREGAGTVCIVLRVDSQGPVLCFQDEINMAMNLTRGITPFDYAPGVTKGQDSE